MVSVKLTLLHCFFLSLPYVRIDVPDWLFDCCFVQSRFLVGGFKPFLKGFHAVSMKALAFFDIYNKLGWEIIPILPHSKKPLMRGWNNLYDRESVRAYIIGHPNCNVGLRLGKIVDIEADSTQANHLLDKLVGGCAHPMYRSEKSTHHLFLTHDPHLTRTTIQGVEFRGYRHQSLLPPSVNAQGVEYKWLTDCTQVIPPPPQSLVNLYQPGASRLTKPWCTVCGCNFAIHPKRYLLEVTAFRSIGMAWQCRQCRRIDIRPMCRKNAPLLGRSA